MGRVERRWRKEGEERVVFRDLQTHLRVEIWRRGRWEKIWWSVSCGRSLKGEDSIFFEDCGGGGGGC